MTIPPYLVQSDMAFLIGMIRKATKEEIIPAKITLTEKTGDALSDYAGVTVIKGNENSITFASRDLNKPFVSFNPAMWDYFEPEMNKRLGDLDVDDSTADIAYLLGYAELNSFLRAFTVWTGQSISAYRQDLLKEN